MKLKSKKGFTMAEVVVAITVISLVSLTTTIIISKSRQLSTATYYYAEARENCRNAIECFKYSETESQFYISLFEFSNLFIKKENKYVCETGMYVLYISVSYSDVDGLKDSFSAECFNNDNKRIFSCNYLRG